MFEFQPHFYLFLLGMVTLASATVGLFFFRFGRKTRDRFFYLFAIAFWLMAATWAILAFLPLSARDLHPAPGATTQDETSYVVYLLRLLAFGFIIFAIIDKNRAARRATDALSS